MRFIILTWMALCLSAPRVGAQTTNSTNGTIRPLSLEESIRLALERNLEIQIERFNPRKAQFTLDASYGLYEPAFEATAIHSSSSREGQVDPNSGVQGQPLEIETDTINTGVRGILPTGLSYDLGGDYRHSTGTSRGFPIDDYQSSAAISLRQPLLKGFWTDVARTQIKINKRELKISEFGLQLLIMDVVTRVQLAYYDLIAARDNVKVQEKALELAQRLVTETKKRVEVGTLAPLDVRQAEAESAGTEADLIGARREFDFRENVLKNLITDNYEAWHPLSLEPTERLMAVAETYNLGQSWLSGLTLRPDFIQLRLELEKQGYLVRLQYNQLFPALDVIGTYGRNGFDGLPTSDFGRTLDDISRERNPQHSVGVILTVPLGNRDARNRHKAAKADREQTQLRLRKLHQDILVQIDDAVKFAQSTFQRVEATRQAVLFSEAALDAEQKKLENGKSTSFFVLQFQRDLTTARGEAIAALAEYNKALAQLYFNEGTTLQRNKITVEYK